MPGLMAPGHTPLGKDVLSLTMRSLLGPDGGRRAASVW